MKVVKQKYKKNIRPNPYKGFVPFYGKYQLNSSMEFFYIPLKNIIESENKYNWSKLENILNEIEKRHHTAIIRVYCDYPSCELALPSYLLKKVKLINYDEFGGGIAPNYNNDDLIDELVKFILEFGKRYDGDNRIAFIECGLIGHWGEWHCYPRTDIMATEVQLEKILQAYSKSFIKTKFLVRYPHFKFLKKYDNVGFHDDSFCYSTEEFIHGLKNNELIKSYLKNSIGGEVRPEVQKSLVLDENMQKKYRYFIQKANCSWLIFQEIFNNKYNKKDIQQLSSEMGYDFYVDNVKYENNVLYFDLHNVGIAPIYYNFDCILNFLDKNNKRIKVKLKYDLRKLIPKSKHTFLYPILNINDYIEISFSLEKNNQIISLSNYHTKDSLVLLCQK